jgi:hypothetical protein
VPILAIISLHDARAIPFRPKAHRVAGFTSGAFAKGLSKTLTGLRDAFRLNGLLLLT